MEGKTFGSYSMQLYHIAYKMEKLEEIEEKSQCSEKQIDFNEQHFGGARPKMYCRDMGADQAIAKENLEDVEKSKCSGIQMDSREHHKDISTGQAISDPKRYYAVSFPSEDFLIKDNPLIFETKKDAIQAIKQNPGARFREFNTEKEAITYASIPYETQVSSSLTEANVRFKTLKTHKLVKFQKCIQNGDVKHFLQLVWSNPRYLINENGHPTVIQEELECNALHVAAISGQTRMLVEILHVLQDFQFMSILHPKDEISKIQARIRCLVGLYLNSTEKIFSETPMFLACRFGHEDIVKIILAFSESLLKNKVDLSIICKAHNCSPNHKKSMINLFTEMYYIPIVQDEVCKYVDKLCDAETVLAAVTTHPLKSGTAAIYCAFAGPAPFATAKEVYRQLKDKKYTFLKPPLKAVMAPSQKCIERDGRKLSKKYCIKWIEYWRSLDAWLDISSSSGLDCLENHLSKLNDQINILPNEPPPFLDKIKNFVEEFLHKICEITVTYDKLCLLEELQTLVLFMDYFVNYSFSNDSKLFDIHEELGHILFLKLTDDNHRNIQNFQLLKLLLFSQFSFITCYQKSMWKMFCCILRFASYFQQDSEFVVKPVCHCDFAVVADLYVYSSKSCYFKLVSWRQDITNELVQKYETMVENPLLQETETHNIPLSSEAKEEELAAKISLLKQEVPFFTYPFFSTCPFHVEDQVPVYKKYFIQSTTFIFVYCTLILNSYGTSGNFMEIFHNVIKSWKPICKLNYQHDLYLTSIHYEMAFCLFVQFYHISAEIVQWCRIQLKNEILNVASTSQEWTHLRCVTNLFLYMLDGNVCDTPCECRYYTDLAMESIQPLKCVMLLRRLRKQLISFKLRRSEFQISSTEEDRWDKDSFSGMKVYVENAFSDEDINIYRALLEARVDISKYHQIKKWKSLVKHTLTQLQMQTPTVK